MLIYDCIMLSYLMILISYTKYKVCTHYFYIVTDYVKKDGHIMILCQAVIMILC